METLHRDVPPHDEPATLDLSPRGDGVAGRPSTITPSRRVFVDERGRRAQWVALAGVLLCVVLLSYVVLLGAALVGAPWVPHGTLPLAGPAGPGGRAIPAVIGLEPAIAPGAPVPGTGRTTIVGSASGGLAAAPPSVPPQGASTVSTGPLSTPSSAGPAAAAPTTSPPPGAPTTGAPSTRPTATTTPITAPGRSGTHGPTTSVKPGHR